MMVMVVVMVVVAVSIRAAPHPAQPPQQQPPHDLSLVLAARTLGRPYLGPQRMTHRRAGASRRLIDPQM